MNIEKHIGRHVGRTLTRKFFSRREQIIKRMVEGPKPRSALRDEVLGRKP